MLCEINAKWETSFKAGNKYSGSPSISSPSSSSFAFAIIIDSKNVKTSPGAYRSVANNPVLDEALDASNGIVSVFGLIFIASKRCSAFDV